MQWCKDQTDCIRTSHLGTVQCTCILLIQPLLILSIETKATDTITLFEITYFLYRDRISVIRILTATYLNTYVWATDLSLQLLGSVALCRYRFLLPFYTTTRSEDLQSCVRWIHKHSKQQTMSQCIRCHREKSSNFLAPTKSWWVKYTSHYVQSIQGKAPFNVYPLLRQNFLLGIQYSTLCLQ